jgi:triacylglycerol lipase
MQRFHRKALLRWAHLGVLGFVLGWATPAASQTYPILLVPGWADDATNLIPLRDLLIEAGWPKDQVVAVSFADPVGSNAAHAREIAEAAEALRIRTGAPQIDVIAHSMGGLATRYFLTNLLRDGQAGFRASPVRRVVFLGTPHRGTIIAALAWGNGGREMLPGSPFLTTLNAQPPVPVGIEALAVRTPVDLRIIPAASGELRGSGVRSIEICCPSHGGLVEDPRVFLEVVLFLQLGLSTGP